ncbi:hypothetical protein AZE42_05867 [Rhizopogon vesiculosus]|uniref:Peptidase C14 caspase domain-containing protein n=1 Tax=Rhizopogon vesiculosus TaxID=180088 RepID=A0A1J8QJB3_9AGAM|nr:hypothetical protein AZE42_05867 [Rhizopogon vesiculosus]
MADSNNAGNKKALLIAVQSARGEGLEPLRYTHEDAQSLRNLLIGRSHYKFDYPEANVVLMMQGKNLPNHLWPKRKNILEQITKMVSGASANDQFFFYFSGHGTYKEELNGKDEGMNTSTASLRIVYGFQTGTRPQTLKKRLVGPLPRGSKLFALWDCAYSGSMLDLYHGSCNRLPSGYAVAGTRRMSLTERFFPDPLSNPRTIRELFTLSLLLIEDVDSICVHRSATADQQPPPRGRAGDPSPMLNSALIRPHSPTSWLLHMFPDSSPSAPARSSSPISSSKCLGGCRKTKAEEQQEVYVVSLSACGADENAYDDNTTGDTFTKFFIECVSQDPKPSLFTLLRHIKSRANQVQRRRLSEIEQSSELRSRLNRTSRRNAVDSLNEYMNRQNPPQGSNECQNPEYTSHYPLDMDQLVDAIF